MFPKNSAFTEAPEQARNFQPVQTFRHRPADPKEGLDQVLFDLNTLSEDLRFVSHLDEAGIQELQRRVEDIRNEVHSSLP